MSKQVINSNNAPQPIGPYSQAILIDRFLFISGQVCSDASGNFHNGSVEEETHQVMSNLKAILTEAGMDFSNVVKTTIFLKNMDDFQTVNHAYGSYFKKNPPARETVEVSRLPKDVKVEISMIAAISASDDYMN
ncbi:MAG: RidA family protein [Microscillaceae bacterium]|jgi:2-iminobutanoate/2-iminopropanoate deaminase|nr:RidA family protein [Microscillaceae bacterium]